MKVLFDGYEVAGDSIQELTMSWKAYDKSFFLGATFCKTITIKLLKDEFRPRAKVVEIWNDNETLHSVMQIDSFQDDEGGAYPTVKVELVDCMVEANIKIDIEDVVPCTLLELATHLAHKMGTELIMTSRSENESLECHEWNSNLTIRDYLRYIGEAFGGYWFINRLGKLAFAKHDKNDLLSIDQNEVSEMKIGDHNEVDRVVFDNGLLKFEKQRASKNLITDGSSTWHAGGCAPHGRITRMEDGTILFENTENKFCNFYSWTGSDKYLELEDLFAEGDKVTVIINGYFESNTGEKPNFYFKAGMGYYLMSQKQPDTWVVETTWKKAGDLLSAYLAWNKIGKFYVKSWGIFKGGYSDNLYDDYPLVPKTLYLDDMNPFIADENIFNVVADGVLGLEYSNLDVGKFPMWQIFEVGQRVGTMWNDTPRNTILQIDEAKYNGKWSGEFKFEVENAKQTETQVSGIDTNIKAILIEIDRINQKISIAIKEIDDLIAKVAEIIIDIDTIILRVAETETNVANVTNNMAQIEIELDGVTTTVSETNTELGVLEEAHSTLEQKVDELTTNFTIKGGNNLIPNSMGQFEDMDETDDFSQGGINTDGVTYQYGEFSSFKNLTESGMALGGLMPAEKDFWIRRITPITVVPGKEYTLTYRLTNIGNNNTLTFAVYHGDKRVELNKTSEQMELREFTYTFIAEADLEYAISGGNADTTIENKAYSYVTELTLVGGNTRQDWQPAANELYGGGVKINYKGIQVYSEGSDTTTYINNTGFDIKSGYGGNSLLTVNKDRTKMNKAEINGGMTLDGISFQKINVGGRNMLMIG